MKASGYLSVPHNQRTNPKKETPDGLDPGGTHGANNLKPFILIVGMEIHLSF